MKTRKLWITMLVFCLIMITNQHAFSADYYWVGNSGDWSDTLHWVTTSGGSTYHNVPPTLNDDVYFDANSFTLTGQAVDITILAECKNMDWTGATNSPDLSGWSELDVFGSIKLISAMTASFSGTLALWSDDFGNTLDFAGVTLNVSLLDVWGYGEWTLASDLNIAGTAPLNMWSGTLNTGNFNVNVNSLDLAPMFMGDEVYINLGSSTININELNIFNSLSVHFDAGTSVINLTTDNLNGVGYEFYDVNLKSSGGLRDYEVLDSNTFHILTFENAASVTFQAGRTTKIDSIVVNGTCAQNVTVQSNNPGSKAYIYKASGAVVSDYLSVNDMKITGGATFTANNSVNLGNVTNWVINEPSGSTDYYWVGGTGNWTDASHWATTSGGAGNGSCIPSVNDNVFFDGNSFTAASQTVTMDMEASFNSMDWTGVTNNPALQASTYDLHVGGSLIFAPSTDMSASLTQKIYFSSDASGNSISMNGFTFSSASLYFSGSGEWNILSDLTLRNLYFNGGTLNTNDHQISLNTTMGSGATAVRNLNLGSSLIITKDWNFTDSTNLNIDASTATIQVSGTILNTGYQNYHNISLTGSGTVNIYKDASIDSLYIAPGLTVALQAGITLAIDKISATGSCGDLTVIKSRTSGVEATITKSSDTLAVEYVQLQDIHATGGAVFINYNGFDNGNNNGWTIDFLTSTTYYWVGNSGNWSDPAHWALTSGGSGNGGCYPNYYDDVVFDENSFTGAGGTVTLDQAAYCHNMDWSQVTGTGNLDGTYDLHIDGSFDISKINNYTVTGKLYFRSDEMGNTINTAGKSLNNEHVYFTGSGEWTLQSEFTVGPSRALIFNNGTLRTNNYNMNIYEFYSESSNVRYLDLGSSVISCTVWLIDVGTNMTINPGTSEIIMNDSGISGGGLSYYNVTINFSGPVSIYHGSNTFHTFNSPNATSLTLEDNSTQTFDSLVVPDGTGCGDLFVLKVGNNLGTATISIPSGSLTVNYWKINDVMAAGGATFTANNSIGTGDVTGWNFSSATIDIGNDTSICEGDSVMLDAGVGNSYLWSTGETTQTIYASVTGVYDVTVTSACGYSNGEINVTVIPKEGATEVITACESYTWIDGITYTENNNTATDTLTNVNGCDSIVTLDLTILKPSTGIDVISACESYTWIDGITYTESNNSATHTLTNAEGCDSVVTLNLTILEPSTGTDVISACESYTWIDGVTYTESNNSASYKLTNSVGCDSVVTLDLTINYPLIVDTMVTVCSGFEYRGVLYDTSGIYSITMPGDTGCDTIVTLDLTIADTCNANAVFKISNNDIRVYPNPVQDRLVVELPSADFNKIEIVDITGKIILTKQVEGEEVTVENMNFETGTYILRIVGKNQSTITKLLIKN